MHEQGVLERSQDSSRCCTQEVGQLWKLSNVIQTSPHVIASNPLHLLTRGHRFTETSSLQLRKGSPWMFSRVIALMLQQVSNWHVAFLSELDRENSVSQMCESTHVESGTGVEP